MNEYRVDKVKQRLNDPGSARLSILGIAYECGFNSEASFYRIFKDIAGVSPKEYLSAFNPLIEFKKRDKQGN
ncbi:MAG: helix-turn-helix domain-containing protein [Bacteroidota bacterium]